MDYLLYGTPKLQYEQPGRATTGTLVKVVVPTYKMYKLEILMFLLKLLAHCILHTDIMYVLFAIRALHLFLVRAWTYNRFWCLNSEPKDHGAYNHTTKERSEFQQFHWATSGHVIFYACIRSCTAFVGSICRRLASCNVGQWNRRNSKCSLSHYVVLTVSLL